MNDKQMPTDYVEETSINDNVPDENIKCLRNPHIKSLKEFEEYYGELPVINRPKISRPSFGAVIEDGYVYIGTKYPDGPKNREQRREVAREKRRLDRYMRR